MKQPTIVKKSLGQHFLCDPQVISELVRFIDPRPNDQIIEIGPGTGALTLPLLARISSLTVIELDHKLLPYLQHNCAPLLSPIGNANLEIRVENVLQTDFSKFTGPLRIVGNLPYNISSPLLFKLLGNINTIQDLHFMLQQEVADRIAAAPGSKTYGRISVMLQYYFKICVLLKVPPQAFTPPPKVNSAIVRLTPNQNPPTVNKQKLALIVKEAFSTRRKTIANNLKNHLTSEQLKKIGINPKLRAENLHLSEFIAITNTLDNH